MKTHSLITLFGLLGLGGLFLAANQDRNDGPPAQAQGQDLSVEVLTRGPVHEAFAEPVETRPEPGPVISRKPPEPIEEMPPEQKPEGENVQWISGYWSWDEDQNDFIWVSGCWREPPPGRQWLPGNWQQAAGGWQWVPGFWASADQSEIQYLPPPPPSVDSGPSAPAAAAADVYVPGIWVFRDNRYLWRPGFWVPFHADWVWTPACYLATPVGYVFVEGFWDRPLDERGLLFAPCRPQRDTPVGTNVTFMPQYVVQPDFLLTALFVRPSRHHYFFGDYFDTPHERQGYVPWVDYRLDKHNLDPHFAYYQHRFAQDRGWEKALRNLYVARREGTIPRPPRTLAEQNQRIQKLAAEKTEDQAVREDIHFSHIHNAAVVSPLARLNLHRVTGLAGLTSSRQDHQAGKVMKLETVSRAQLAREQQAAAHVREVGLHRHQVEGRLLSEAGTRKEPSSAPRAARIELPRTSTVPLKPGKVNKSATPPAPVVPHHEERPIPRHESATPAPAREAPASREGPRKETGPKSSPHEKEPAPVPQPPRKEPPIPQPKPPPATKPEAPAPHPREVPQPAPKAPPAAKPEGPAPHPHDGPAAPRKEPPVKKEAPPPPAKKEPQAPPPK